MSDDNGTRFFCHQTGVRLVAPGVSKTVDPINGVEEFHDSPAAPAKQPAAKSAKKEAE
jgi:hypothetical protein